MTNSWSQEKYIKALKYAAIAHKKQKVPGTNLSYLMHISLVCMEVFAVVHRQKQINGDLTLQCALLHDTIEDTKITYQKLVSDFGTEVADGVRALSKNRSLPAKDRLPDSLYRIKQQPYEIWIVKMADRITNLQKPPFFWTRSKIRNYHQQACQIYQSLKEADATLAARLKNKTDNYLQYIKE